LYCIVLYFRLFPNIGDKTHPFTVYDTIMQKVRVETQIKIKITLKAVKSQIQGMSTLSGIVQLKIHKN